MWAIRLRIVFSEVPTELLPHLPPINFAALRTFAFTVSEIEGGFELTTFSLVAMRSTGDAILNRNMCPLQGDLWKLSLYIL